MNGVHVAVVKQDTTCNLLRIDVKFHVHQELGKIQLSVFVPSVTLIAQNALDQEAVNALLALLASIFILKPKNVEQTVQMATIRILVAMNALHATQAARPVQMRIPA